MSVQEMRHNLQTGVFLIEHDLTSLEDTLAGGIGYDPTAVGDQADYDYCYRRLQRAMQVGREKYTQREPGWFFISAQPFGNGFRYRAVWYVSRGRRCLPLLQERFDLHAMAERRRRDAETRVARTRAVVAADALREIQRCLASGNVQGLDQLYDQLRQDTFYGPLMEVVTGHYGVPFVELLPFVQLLLQHDEQEPHRLLFRTALADIRTGMKHLERGRTAVANQLANLVAIRGVQNPRMLAESEARALLQTL